MTTLLKSLALGALLAFAAVIAGLMYGLPSIADARWPDVLRGLGSFACLGFFLGGIYAFDPDSDLKIKSSSVGRSLFGVVSAAVLSLLWQWPREGLLLAVVIGAILGHLGLLWAKYVQF